MSNDGVRPTGVAFNEVLVSWRIRCLLHNRLWTELDLNQGPNL